MLALLSLLSGAMQSSFAELCIAILLFNIVKDAYSRIAQFDGYA